MRKFENNAVVCFFGDSITANDNWQNRIFDYYLNTAHIPCEMYNCGVPGNNAAAAINRIEHDVLALKPTDVVIMFGMNDIWRHLYNGREETPELLKLRDERINICIESIKTMSQIFKNKGIGITYCTPTICDELSELPLPPTSGAAEALKILSVRLQFLSEFFGAELVDFNSATLRIQKELVKNRQSIIGDDRVHPNLCGQEYMAQYFLQCQGFPITLATDFEELTALSSRPLGKTEQELEQIKNLLCNIDFCIWDQCGGLPEPECSERLNELLKTGKKLEYYEYLKQAAAQYFENKNNIDKLKQKMINLTKSLKEESLK